MESIKNIGFRDGFLHLLDQPGEIAFDRIKLITQSADHPWVEVVFQEQHLVVEGFA